jgi:DNA-binding winged helix-turn-helix (wHTH) protein/Tfp pilus assembly protein PilF
VQSDPRTVRFDEFELDLAAGELRRKGAPVNLAPQPLRLLALLASRPGELISRETIRLELWGEDIHVDFEHGLNACIRQIRVALADQAQSWRFIETVRRRGYRFHLQPATAVRSTSRYRRIAALASGFLIMAAIAYAVIAGRRNAQRAQAHDFVVEGRLYSARFTADAQRSAILSFEKAIEIDPQSAPAYAGLAGAYALTAFDRGMRYREASVKAEQASRTAFSLDPNSSDAHLALARTRFQFKHDWTGAEVEFRRALALAPANVEALTDFGTLLYLEGRFSEGEEQIRQALALDPSSVRVLYQLACQNYYSRNFDAAIVATRKALQVDSRYAWAHHMLGLALLAKHQYEDALAEFQKSQRGPSGNLGNAYAIASRRTEAQGVLDQLRVRYESEGVGAVEIAQVYVGLGNDDQALGWLNTALADGAPMFTLKVAPVFDPIRSDPRFVDLLRKVGF